MDFSTSIFDSKSPGGSSPKSTIGHITSSAKKSRHRVPTSCSVCRKKKVKCDKSRPYCSACVRSSACSACYYESQPWDASLNFKRLNQQVIQLKQQNAEYRELLEKYKTRLNDLLGGSNGERKDIFATRELQERNLRKPLISGYKYNGEDKDEITDLVKDFDVLVIKENKLIHFGMTSFMSMVTNDPIISDVFNKFIVCQKEMYDRGKAVEECRADSCDSGMLNKHSQLTLTQILNPINALLPPRRIFDGLILRFFEKCYILMPFVDEVGFRQRITNLVHDSENGYCYFQILSPSHLPTVALALLFLRFAYLTVPVEFVKSQLEQKKTAGVDDFSREIVAANVQIMPIVVEHAKNCITNSSVLRKANLHIVQALLFLKFYKSQSPEDGDGGIDAQVSLLMLVQMARMIGLHRDPNNFDIIEDPNYKHLWRKMWYKLVEMDVTASIRFGAQLLISDDDSFDTELPYIGLELQKLSRLNTMEPEVVAMMALEYEASSLFRRILHMVNIVKQNPKRLDINQFIQDLRDFRARRIRPLREIISQAVSPGYDLSRRTMYASQCRLAKEALIGLNTEITVHVLTYILMLKTPSENQQMKFNYLRKTVISALTVFRFVHGYLSHELYYFGHDLNRLLLPLVLELGQRAFQLMCVLVVRHHLDFNDIFLEDEVDDDAREAKEWLTANRSAIAQMMGMSEFDNQVISFQVYSYLEEVYCHLETYGKMYFLAWKSLKLIQMFMVYLIEKRPEYREFLNRRFQERQRRGEDLRRKYQPSAEDFRGIIPPEDFLQDCRKNNSALQEFERYAQKSLGSLDVYNMIKQTQAQSNSSWLDLLDESGQLKFDSFHPLFAEDQVILEMINDITDSNMPDLHPDINLFGGGSFSGSELTPNTNLEGDIPDTKQIERLLDLLTGGEKEGFLPSEVNYGVLIAKMMFGES